MLQPGQTLDNGRYQIEKRLSQGGMGRVYLAWDKNLRKRVAIKENLVGTGRRRKQFESEAGLLSRLKHPNLPSVTNYFTEASGQQYIVMEYVDGHDLQEILDSQRKPFDEKDALNWIEQVIDAVSYMHAWTDTETGQPQSILHRDIKPSNIKKTPNGQIYLVDFGLAKPESVGTTLSGAGGTSRGFSPPEQYAEGEGTTARSDIYAIGATLYTLLTGRRPPAATEIMGGSTLAPPRQINTRISHNTERAILKAMQLHAHDRYASVNEFLRALNGSSMIDKITSLRPPTAHLGSTPKPQSATAVSQLMRTIVTVLGLVIFGLLGYILFTQGNQFSPSTTVSVDTAMPEITAEQIALAAATNTVLPTDTKSPPTMTPVPPTDTPIPPTNTPDLEQTKESRSALIATDVAATISAQPTATNEPTNTPTKAPTKQPTATKTATRKPTATRRPTATPTAEDTATSTPTNTPEPTETPVSTNTPVPTNTLAPTSTPIPNEPAAGSVKEFGGISFVYVPSGTFIMGSTSAQIDAAYASCHSIYDGCDRKIYEDEAPQRSIHLDGFWVMRTEMTNADFARFIAAGGYQNDAYWDESGWEWVQHEKIIEHGGRQDSRFRGERQPVSGVSWYEAQAYARWLSESSGLIFQLPTEAQWEKAARGADGRTYPWGTQFDGSRANYCDQNCFAETVRDQNGNDLYEWTAPTSNYSAGVSPYGAFDMAGNVWEWTQDWYSERTYDTLQPSNPIGPTTGTQRVSRGGSFANFSASVRTMNRKGFDPVKREATYGFRLIVLTP